MPRPQLSPTAHTKWIGLGSLSSAHVQMPQAQDQVPLSDASAASRSPRSAAAQGGQYQHAGADAPRGAQDELFLAWIASKKANAVPQP